MEQWWRRNSSVDLGSYTQNEVEDLTGCIPLLLDNCMVNGKINLFTEALQSVFNQVQQFMTEVVLHNLVLRRSLTCAGIVNI